MGEVGAYVLDLYCDSTEPTCPEVGRSQFTGANYTQAVLQAQKTGWQMRRRPFRMEVDVGGYPPWVCPHCALVPEGEKP